MAHCEHLFGAARLPQGSALLVVQRGPNAGTRFVVDRPVTSAGRDAVNDIVLDDVTVSDRHAEFRWHDNDLGVVDLGSRSGTYVNRELVNSATVANGDKVYIGAFCLMVLTRRNDD